MAFLSNTAVNRLNLHSAIQALAAASGGVFLFAFLLRAGLSVPAAFLALAAIFAGRFVMRPLVVPLAARLGLRPVLVTGTIAMALQYPVLAEVRGADFALVAFIAVAAVADVLYWPAYHAYFAALGDAEHRGHQVAAREAAMALVGIIGPLLGAAGLTSLGARPTFWTVGAIQMAAALPLLGAPNVAVAHSASGGFGAAARRLPLFVADGWIMASFYLVWQVALFVAVDRSFTAYGGAVAFAALVGAIGSLLLGRHIDAGGGRRAVLIGGGVLGLVTLLRAVSLGSPWLAAAANAPAALAGALWNTTMGGRVYNIAKSSICPLRFLVVAEAGYDAGGSAGCLAAAALTSAGLSLAAPILLALPGIGLAGWALWRAYAGEAADASAATVRAR